MCTGLDGGDHDPQPDVARGGQPAGQRDLAEPGGIAVRGAGQVHDDGADAGLQGGQHVLVDPRGAVVIHLGGHREDGGPRLALIGGHLLVHGACPPSSWPAMSAGGDTKEGMTADGALREEAERCLRSLAGESARLRDDQWTAIRALASERRRALVVQRTGWGKSAVYFVSTALLRARGMGPAVIISPLLALMRNQIGAAAQAGLRARTVNSANVTEWEEIYAQIADDAVDLLLVSPERLNNPGFRDLVLPKLAATAGLLVVDEAHCISDWGHDFRPDYRRLRTLLAGLPPGVPVLATTATANARVTRDVAEQLASGADGEVLVLRGPLDRRSLHLAVVRLPAAQQRLGWLAEHLDKLPGSGIVYALTVAAAHETAAFLRERGYQVAPYTGRDEQADRLAAEEALLGGELKALIATSALGMGFDKPDLGFVVHLGAPQSPVAYYQQIGRAGRAVPRAEVVLLPGAEDRDIWAYFASLAFPPEPVVRATLAALEEAGRPLSSAALEARVDLSRARLEMMLKVLDADGAVRKVTGGWAATGAAAHPGRDAAAGPAPPPCPLRRPRPARASRCSCRTGRTAPPPGRPAAGGGTPSGTARCWHSPASPAAPGCAPPPPGHNAPRRRPTACRSPPSRR